MYNIIDQSNISSSRSSSMLNETVKPVITTTSAGYKIDCAKECPCGVPVIPVPDQWLEVMVTGGFKVWHIIFIIIAFLVTIVVVYCCFHRCRIPRTKQEIEADLMRSNLTNKFREYLQEFPNEPTTFLEALKRVQDLEEKSEQDDMGAKKRKGWLKRMGKERGEKGGEPAKEETTVPDELAVPAAGALEATEELPAYASGTTHVPVDPSLDAAVRLTDKPSTVDGETTQPAAKVEQPKSKSANKKALRSKASGKMEKPQQRDRPQDVVVANHSAKTNSEKLVANPLVATGRGRDEADKQTETGAAVPVASVGSRPARARRKRDKPNLSRTKATHGGSRGESIEANHNVLTIPVAGHHHHHHQQKHHRHHSAAGHHHEASPAPVAHDQPQAAAVVAASHRRVRSKTKEPRDSTVIQIDPSLAPAPSSSSLSSSGSKSKRDRK